MKRKIAYIMSLLLMSLALLFLFGKSTSVEAVKISGVDLDAVAEDVWTENNYSSSPILAVGYNSGDYKDNIGGKEYYSYKATSTLINVPIIIINAAWSNSYRVSYSTSDYTAIDGVDYTGISGTISINRSNFSEISVDGKTIQYFYSYVSIYGNRSKFSIANTVDDDASTGTISSGRNYSNAFMLNVESNSAALLESETSSTISVHLPGEIEDVYGKSQYFTSIGDSTGSHYALRTYEGDGVKKLDDVSGVDDDSSKLKNYSYDFDETNNSFTKAMALKYINAGYANAYMYYSGKNDLSKNVSDKSEADVTMSTDAGDKIFECYVREDDDDRHTITSNSHNSTAVQISKTSTSLINKYVKIPNNNLSGFKAYYESNTFWTNTKFYDQSVSIRIGDTTRPYLTDSYLDTSELSQENHIIYYKLRFSEPVYATSNTGFYATINNNDYGARMKFRYYGGSLTDTLVFVTDLDEYTGDAFITSIRPIGFCTSESKSTDYQFTDSDGTTYSFDGVYDLSSLLNKPANSYGAFDYTHLTGYYDGIYNPLNLLSEECSIDTRTPYVTVKHSTSILNTHTTTFVLDNCSNGEIYYIFSEDSSTPTDWSGASIINYEANSESNYTKTVTTSGLKGIWYIHVKVKTAFGDESATITHSGLNGNNIYKFDNTGPEVEIVADSANDVEKRAYTITSTDLPSVCSIGTKAIYVVVYDEDDNEVLSLKKTSDSYTFSVYAQGDTNSLGLGDGERGTYKFVYYAVDELENQSEEKYFYAQFDTNDYFDGDLTADEDCSEVITNSSDEREIILRSKTTDASTEDNPVYYNTKITVTFTNPTEDSGVYEVINGLTIYDANGTDIAADLVEKSTDYYSNDYISVTYTNNDSSNGNDRTAVVEFIGHGEGTLDYGYFDLRFTTDSNRSYVYRIYIGTNNNDPYNVTTIEETNIILNNVVKLPDSYSLLYYLTDTNNVVSLKTEKYHSTATTSNPVFSSLSVARDFVYAMEFNDISAVCITAQMAASLKSGTTNYIMASGETVTPAAGQVWIRYKLASWTYESGSSTWRWYYYSSSGDGTSVNPGSFSSNLITAMNTVADTICASLYSDYLVDDVDEYGNPRISATATFADSITVTESKSGTTFTMPVSYSGDDAIYVNTIKPSDTSEAYKLASNYVLTITSDTRLFFYYNDKYYPISKEYNGIKVVEALKDILNISASDFTSQVIQIFEFDENGSKSIEIYLDIDAPDITINIVGADDSVSTRTLSSESDNLIITGKAVTLSELNDTDDYCYAVLYTYVRMGVGTFLKFYRKTDIKNTNPIINNGNYILSISDRSGNDYSIYIFIDNSELEVTQTVATNEYFRIDCNRTESQISLFEVYFNGNLVTNTYDLTTRYTSSGLYRILIKDIYGHTYDEYYEFVRDYPTVTWSYYYNGLYNLYKDPAEKTASPMILTQTGDGEFTIITNTSLQFTYSTTCGFVFETEPEDYTVREMTNSVLIGSNGDVTKFVLKVYYNNLQNLFSRYICYVDTTAPTIKARCTYNEYNLDTDSENVKIDEDGNLITPVSFWYENTSSSSFNYAIEDEQESYSEEIKINVTDENDILSVLVYLEGELINEYYEIDDFECIFEKKFGLFRIVASDIYGNQSEFVFENVYSSDFEYYVDGDKIVPNADCTINFNDDKVYENIDYGHTQATIKMLYEGWVRIKVAHGSDIDYFVLKQSGYSLYYYRYTAEQDPEGNYILGMSKKNTIEFNKDETNSGTINIGSININYGYTVVPGDYINKTEFVLTFEVIDDEELLVDLRYDTRYGTPYYVKFGLSTYATPAVFYNENNEVIKTSSTNIKFSSAFTLLAADSESKVVVLYDVAGHFIYNNNIYEEGKFYSDEGAYLITVTNKYGNVVTYNLIFYESYLVAVSVKYDDKTTFSFDNPSEVYSNNLITVVLYDESEITITKDGEAYSPTVTVSNDVISFTLSEIGEYKVSLLNIYGNLYEFDAHIVYKDIVETDLLSGFNEDALKRNEGYTNKLITINYDVAAKYSYLSVNYNNEVTNVLLDMISGANIELDSSVLAEYIGKQGNGVYEIVIRDIYGNKHTDIVNYKGNTTFELSRRTRTSLDDEAYDTAFAQASGFWSNNTLNFASTAELYSFAVDGKVITLPYKINYPSTSNDGYYSYKITYIDEYGYKYEFNAYLVRKTIAISVASDVKTTEIDGVTTTRYPFSMEYDDTNTCKYYKDSVEYSYDGSVINEDGSYRFVSTDLAGNTTSYTIVKDSIVEFTFKNSAAEKEVIYGETIVVLRMTFAAKNGDSAYITAAYKDGEEIKDFTSIFNEAGKYEFLISDDAGNETYFKFEMINEIVGSFEYETPYSFLVESVTYYNKLISEISYMEYVDQYLDYSKMKFTEDGFYKIVTRSKDTGEVITLSFEINTAEPEATLKGVEDGGSTINDVNLNNLKAGDVVMVYCDGKLVNTYYINIDGEGITSISSGGSYEIVVTNKAGISKTLTFTRKHTANVAGSALVVIGAVVAVGLIFFGILQHNRKKTDE